MKRFLMNIPKHLLTRNVLKSLAISVVLIIIGYFSNNWPLFTGENLSLYTRMEFIRNLFDSQEDDFSGAFFVNTSMDKQLIDVYEDGYQVGKTEITDRRKLLEFLKLLEKVDTAYEYIVIDLRFVEGLACQDSIGAKTDSQLFEQIKSMDQCVVATHHDLKLLGGLEPKAALADYKSTVTATNFVRYEYYDSIPSIPLHVYNELRKSSGLDTIRHTTSNSLFGLYNEGGHLCQNSLFLEFSSKGFPKLKKLHTELGDSIFIEKFNYRDLGFDFIDHLDSGVIPEEEILESLEGCMKEAGQGRKPIVFIGNVLEDLHDTYAGLQPGVVILYKAIRALQEGKHLVNTWHYLILFFTYFLLCLFILKDKTVFNLLPQKFKERWPFLMILFQLSSLSAVLVIIDIIDIKWFSTTTNFVVIAFIFNILKLYVQFNKIKHNEKNN